MLSVKPTVTERRDQKNTLQLGDWSTCVWTSCL